MSTTRVLLIEEQSSTEELLTEEHEVGETPLLTSMFFVGFIALLTIEMLV